ncbi:alpha/beta hydrolase [Pseudomaricurvus alkylphenolicus]|uniref:alpha/beta fold hydrolase n=1 Tax=Pseudomaricurvus alkylphenolicus TaxID=1306991 RepID=UPI00141F4C49|nr:alpha/beta hydrolase [Pseudomaricurvus alkylphenolicus]NIB42860.1 alpha/beta hydrolase [Pseudomaricurvus alkylphenolicus]
MSLPRPPSMLETALETMSGVELARLALAYPELVRTQGGKPNSVLVLPGIGASNLSTVLLRRFLEQLGHRVKGWELGRNLGDVHANIPRIAGQVADMSEADNGPVSIIGWSLGGILGREVAREYPALVQQVITLGSPILGGAKYTRFADYYRRRGIDLNSMEARLAARDLRPITVPVTCIYSKLDGIVHWRAAIDRTNPDTRHHEVRSTHLGLVISPDVFRIIAAELVQK